MRRSARHRDHRGRGRSGHHRVRHRAGLRSRRARPGPGRAPGGRRAEKRRGRLAGSDRHQGRDDAPRRRLGSGRPRQDDPRRLRGESDRAGRTGHRPVPDPRPRSTHALAHFRPGPGPPARRVHGGACRGVQRQPPSAGRGARAGSARRGRGGAERVRRPRAPRRDRRALRGARHRGHRALAAGRPASRPGPGSASGLGRRRPRRRGDPGRDRARLAAPALAGDRARFPGRDGPRRRGRPLAPPGSSFHRPPMPSSSALCHPPRRRPIGPTPCPPTRPRSS